MDNDGFVIAWQRAINNKNTNKKTGGIHLNPYFIRTQGFIFYEGKNAKQR